MTKERYRIVKPVMDAWHEGKRIQVKDGESWTDYIGYNNVRFECHEWRIKPVPLEVYVVLNQSDEPVWISRERETAIRHAECFSKELRVELFRQVIEP